MTKQYVETSEEGTFYYKDPGMTLLHREDGPAIEAYDCISWWVDGYLHRENGPAIEWANGSKEWYLYGHNMSEEVYNELIAQYVRCKRIPAALKALQQKPNIICNNEC